MIGFIHQKLSTDQSMMEQLLAWTKILIQVSFDKV
jgi:hypothetical protein